MKNTCKSCCERDGETVRELAHVKKGATHYLCMDKAEGLVPAMFEAAADYVAGDSFVLNCEDYIVVPQDGNELKAGFFRQGALVSVLVDTEGKCLGFTSGNGVKRLPDSAEGHLLVGGPDGEPADSGKTVADFDPAGSAQVVQSEMWEHVCNEVIHIDANEREGWNGKADKAVGCKPGNLAALDPQGNPIDSGLAPGDVRTKRLAMKYVQPTTKYPLNSSTYYTKSEDGMVFVNVYAVTSGEDVKYGDVLFSMPEDCRPVSSAAALVAMVLAKGSLAGYGVLSSKGDGTFSFHQQSGQTIPAGTKSVAGQISYLAHQPEK